MARSDFAARDLGDDLASRNLDGCDDDADDTGAVPETPRPVRSSGNVQDRQAAMRTALQGLPGVRYMMTLARSLTAGAPPEMRPIKAEHRAKGVVLVVQVLPDGRRVIYR